MVSPCGSTTSRAHRRFISTRILEHQVQTEPLPVLAAILSCSDLREPQPVESSPPGGGLVHGGTHAWQRGQLWQEMGSCPYCHQLGSTQEACASLSDFPKGEIGVKMGRKDF